MAGAGKKTFAVNEVLSAADVNNYLMDQSVMRFADSTARSSAIPSPSEGMVSYLDDTNQVEVYDGSGWVNFTGDITQVTAGTGLSGGGTEGNVTLNAVDATPTSVGVVKGLTDVTNVALGENALSVNTGVQNTAIGYDSLVSNTSGQRNSALGESTLQSNTTGSNNNAFGRDALRDNTTGTLNNAMGVSALVLNTTGSDNTAIGNAALLSNTTASANTAIGKGALQDNTTGIDNSALGLQALRDNVSGNRNVAVGRDSLLLGTTGTDNVAVGDAALFNNNSDNNVAVGKSSMQLNTTGADNTAIGRSVLFNNTTGIGNVSLGLGAGDQNTTGSQNVFVGRSAGNSTTTGDNVVVLGWNADASSATVSNEITLGNSSITNLRCNDTSISGLSDARDKTNIQDSPLGLDLIQRLRPVTFDWDRRDGSMSGMKDVGFIAQQVIEVEDDLDIHKTLRMSSRENEDKYEVAPARLIPVLTKAIQELSEQNAELKARLDKLEGK